MMSRATSAAWLACNAGEVPQLGTVRTFAVTAPAARPPRAPAGRVARSNFRSTGFEARTRTLARCCSNSFVRRRGRVEDSDSPVQVPPSPSVGPGDRGMCLLEEGIMARETPLAALVRCLARGHESIDMPALQPHSARGALCPPWPTWHRVGAPISGQLLCLRRSPVETLAH